MWKMESILDEQGRICIPSELRKRFNLVPGDKLVFFIENEKIVIKKAIEPRELIDKARKVRKLIKQTSPEPIDFKDLF